MKQTGTSNVSSFPTARRVRPEQDLRGAPQHVGNAALAEAFDIDEPDPFLSGEEMMFGDRTHLHGQGLQLLTREDTEKTRRKVRLKDLHPIDVLIICGFVALAVIL